MKIRIATFCDERSHQRFLFTSQKVRCERIDRRNSEVSDASLKTFLGGFLGVEKWLFRAQKWLFGCAEVAFFETKQISVRYHCPEVHIIWL